MRGLSVLPRLQAFQESSTLPETNIFAAENGWLKKAILSLKGMCFFFRGLADSFREYNLVI